MPVYQTVAMRVARVVQGALQSIVPENGYHMRVKHVQRTDLNIIDHKDPPSIFMIFGSANPLSSADQRRDMVVKMEQGVRLRFFFERTVPGEDALADSYELFLGDIRRALPCPPGPLLRDLGYPCPGGREIQVYHGISSITLRQGNEVAAMGFFDIRYRYSMLRNDPTRWDGDDEQVILPSSP
jgi:hypothetical protein